MDIKIQQYSEQELQEECSKLLDENVNILDTVFNALVHNSCTDMVNNNISYKNIIETVFKRVLVHNMIFIQLDWIPQQLTIRMPSVSLLIRFFNKETNEEIANKEFKYTYETQKRMLQKEVVPDRYTITISDRTEADTTYTIRYEDITGIDPYITSDSNNDTVSYTINARPRIEL